MKKIICACLCVLFISIMLVGCSSAIVPSSTPTWADGEILSYTVRRASEYELNAIGISSDYKQLLPSVVDGTYTTTVSSLDDDHYQVKSVLNATEVYTPDDFGADTELLNKAKNLANSSADDGFALDGENLVATLYTESVCTFDKTTFLPTFSSKKIQSVVIVRSTAIDENHRYQGECSLNDITCTTNYDYSAKSPKATVNSSLLGEEFTKKLQKSSSAKTYDNEQLEFLLRSFSLDTLKTNRTTSIQLFNGVDQKEPVALSISVGTNPTFDYLIGGTWSGTNDDDTFTYYTTEDGQTYTDQYGNPVTTMQRSVAMMSVTTGGIPVFYYFDNANRDSLTAKNALIRMQYSYIVCDIDEASLATL